MANAVTNLNQQQPKAKAETKSDSTDTRTGHDLLAYLTQTGSGPARLRRIGGFLHDSPKISAEELYREMEEAEPAFSMGTLQKACKFVFGEQAEPTTLVQSNPADELARLRSENENLKRSIADRDAKNAMLAKRLELERTKVADNLRAIAMNKQTV